MRLNSSPSGPFFKGSANGQIAVWNVALQRWTLSAQQEIGFTYVITSRQDLVDIVAPVNGEFALPNGSYSVKNDIQLESGEYLSVSGWVSFFGAGFSQIFGPDDSPEAVLRARDLSVVVLRDIFIASNTAGQPAIRLGELADVQLFGGGAYNMSGNTVELLGSDCEFWAFGSYLYGETRCIEHIAGVIYGNGALIQSGNNAGGACIYQSGVPNSKRGFLSNCFFNSYGQTPFIVQNSANASLNVVGCEMVLRNSSNVPAAISLLLSRSLYLDNVLFYNQSGGSRTAISVAGTVQELNASNCRHEAFNSMCVYSSGVVDRAAFIGNGMDGGSTFLNWPAANIPSNGLLLVGNQPNTAAFFTGFTAASPRVNAKANSLNGALVSETPLVP